MSLYNSDGVKSRNYVWCYHMGSVQLLRAVPLAFAVPLIFASAHLLHVGAAAYEDPLPLLPSSCDALLQFSLFLFRWLIAAVPLPFSCVGSPAPLPVVVVVQIGPAVSSVQPEHFGVHAVFSVLSLPEFFFPALRSVPYASLPVSPPPVAAVPV